MFIVGIMLQHNMLLQN